MSSSIPAATPLSDSGRCTCRRNLGTNIRLAVWTAALCDTAPRAIGMNDSSRGQRCPCAQSA
eukprot:3295217-Prymnesium_polylepis.1